MEDAYGILFSDPDLKGKDKLNCVLVIDDDTASRFLHRYLIDDLAIAEKIVEYEDALEALAFLEKQIVQGTFPNLILLDLIMPGMDGLEFLNQYQTKGYHLQGDTIVAVVTISNDPAHIKQVWNTQFALYSAKPLQKDKVKELTHLFFKQQKDQQNQ